MCQTRLVGATAGRGWHKDKWARTTGFHFAMDSGPVLEMIYKANYTEHEPMLNCTTPTKNDPGIWDDKEALNGSLLLWIQDRGLHYTEAIAPTGWISRTKGGL